MSSQVRTSGRVKTKVIGGIFAVGALALAGCSPQSKHGFLPIDDMDTTNHTRDLAELWNHSWIASMIVGLLTWGLALWCIVAYRRRKGDTGYPKQLSYSLPLEVFYTAVPIAIVMTFFTFTHRTQSKVDSPEESELTVNVYGKQWAWDFNYDYKDEEHYEVSTQVHEPGKVVDEAEIPTLYLPVDVPVHFKLNSRDVIHSFWIPAFLQKIDMVPGKQNHIWLTPQKEGTYSGKCAELCGEYHSEMLFNVKVVSESEFEDQLQKMNKGNIGAEYNRLEVSPTNDATYKPHDSEQSSSQEGK